MEIIWFLIISLCQLILVNQIHVNAMNITSTFNARFNITSNVSSLSFLVQTSSSLCLAVKSEEILSSLIKLFNNNYKPVVFNDFTKLSFPYVGVFILDTNNLSVLDCERVFASYHKTVVYVVEDSISADFLYSLEACLVMAQSQEVFALSLSDSSLFQLSPVYPQPRHFLKTSVAEVLQLRAKKSNKLDLQGSELTIGTLYYIPFFIYEESNPTNTDEYDGMYAVLVKEMARQFNFSCTYLIDKYYGKALDNGTWTDGLAQLIQEGRVDIVATNMWQVPEFYKLADFGPALNKAKMSFLVLRPEVIDFNWQEVLHIFKPKVWFAILGSFVLTVLVYWAGVNWDPRPGTESWSGCILTMFGYFMSSTSHSRVKEGNTRFSLTGWSVFSLLITTSLSTGIVTRLTIPTYSPRINTVEQLVEGKYFWTVQFYADFKNNTMLKQSMFDLEDHWIQQFEQRYVYVDEDEVRKTAGTDKRMVFVAQTYGNDFVVLETDGLDAHKSLRNYRVSTEAFTAAHVTFGVKKQSFLFEPLTEFTVLILQAGLVSHWQEEVIRRWPQYDTRHLLIEQDIPTFSEPRGLPLYKLQPVFLLLLLGLGLASVVFCIEIFWQS